MNNEPVISVIVPVYNVESYLEKCVESLLNQSYSNLEIVLVDDGSPDSCGAICDRYAERNKNILSLHKKNGGLGDARNYGVQHSTGRYIAFVDSDDYVEQNYISDMWDLMCRHNSDLVITRLVRELESSQEVKCGDKFEPFEVDSHRALFEAYSGAKIGWSACAKLYNKSVLLQFPFPEGFYEDCAVMYKIILCCNRVVIADHENNYHYIERTGSILKSDFDARHLHIFDICEAFENYLKEKNIYDEVLTIALYRRAVTQILNLQYMSDERYEEIFYRYRNMFRKNLGRLLRDPRLAWKAKIHSLLLCTTPSIYRLQYKVIRYTRK